MVMQCPSCLLGCFLGERWFHSEVDRLNGNVWKISRERRQLKCGSASTLKEFRRLIGQIVEEDKLHQQIPTIPLKWMKAK